MRVELLETRALPSVVGLPQLLNPLPETETNDTLDLALDLGSLTDAGLAEVVGTIGNSDAGAADIDWYQFTLTRSATVTVTAFNPQGDGSAASVISLYNNAVDVFDPFVPTGHRLVAQDDGAAHEGVARIDPLLAPGTYFLAVSGSGNRYFYPFLANSGAEGVTGDYAVVFTATDWSANGGDGPHVLRAEPADGAAMERSPFELRLAFSRPLDPSTVIPGGSVFLTYNPNGTFGDGNDREISVRAAFSTSANELQLMPVSPLTLGQQPLDRGHYQLLLLGGSVTDLVGVPLGSDFVLTFQIDGTEGRTGAAAAADDTAATAHDFGDLSGAGLVQIAGAIGDDPAYNPANPNPLLANPAADVDLYHFQVAGQGRHTLVVQVSAGSIGYWQLDPALSLFRFNPADGRLHLVAMNDNTLNDTQARDGTTPLSGDAALFAGLEAGDYYLAVSGSGNLPNPALGIEPGTNGVFDPHLSHSGRNGFSTGNYVLHMLAHPDNEAPQVKTVSLEEGAVLNVAPAHFSVRFNEATNLQQLAYIQDLLTASGELAVIFLRGSDGVDYYPRLLSYNRTTNQADFLMLDRLPNGAAELHLSGVRGLTDLAGNPLAGNDSNDPAADYVVRFTVNGPGAGTAGDPLLWTAQEPNDTLESAQELGVLFPHELQAGVTIQRDFTGDLAGAPADAADVFRFEVLQSRGYFFALNGTGLQPGTRPELFTAAGQAVFTTGDAVRLANLDPGVYYVRVGGWTTDEAANVTYQLRITLGGSAENPTPLTAGPAPAYRIRFRDATGGDGGNPEGGPTRLGLEPADGSAVVPAVITPSAGTSPSLAGLPANALAQLSEVPLGGVRSTAPSEGTPGPDRLVLPGTDEPPSNGVIRLAWLDRYGEEGPANEAPSGDEREAAPPETTPLPEEARRQILDGLFEREDSNEWVENWPGMLWVPLTIPDSFLKDHTEAEERLDFDEQESEVPGLSEEDVSDSPVTDLVWAAGVLAAAGFVAVGLERPRHPPTVPEPAMKKATRGGRG